MPRYAMPIRSDELYHYGRQGMKWYKHIFGPIQKIGKYASKTAGKFREKHNSEEYKESKKQKKIERSIKKEEHNVEKDIKKQEKVYKRHEDLIRSGDVEAIYKNRKRLSDDELRRAYNRLKAENDLKSLLESENRQNNGQQFVNNQNKKNTKSFIDTAINLANTFDKVANGVDKATNAYSTLKKYTPEARKAAENKKKIFNNDDPNEFLNNYNMFSSKERQDYLNKINTRNKILKAATGEIVDDKKDKKDKNK